VTEVVCRGRRWRRRRPRSPGRRGGPVDEHRKRSRSPRRERIRQCRAPASVWRGARGGATLKELSRPRIGCRDESRSARARGVTGRCPRRRGRGRCLPRRGRQVEQPRSAPSSSPTTGCRRPSPWKRRGNADDSDQGGTRQRRPRPWRRSA
jgi:hypothetical protein